MRIICLAAVVFLVGCGEAKQEGTDSVPNVEAVRHERQITVADENGKPRNVTVIDEVPVRPARMPPPPTPLLAGEKAVPLPKPVQ